MPDFDIIGTPPGQGLFAGLGHSQGVAQPQAMQQPGPPISGIVAGALGLPITGGANPGMSYLAQGQGQQQLNGGQGQPQQQQFQQMSPLLAGIIGSNQPGSLAGAAVGSPQAAQPQSNNMGSSLGGLLGQIVYGSQSRDV